MHPSVLFLLQYLWLASCYLVGLHSSFVPESWNESQPLNGLKSRSQWVGAKWGIQSLMVCYCAASFNCLVFYELIVIRVFNRPEFSGRHDFQAKKFRHQCTKSGSHAVGLQEKSSKNLMQNKTYYIAYASITYHQHRSWFLRATAMLNSASVA